jgi:hypothetical protein
LNYFALRNFGPVFMGFADIFAKPSALSALVFARTPRSPLESSEQIHSNLVIFQFPPKISQKSEGKMTESKTPWHIWTVGIISLLWNAMGAMDFIMSNLQTESYMAQLNEAQTAFFAGFPLWATLSWAVAVFGAALGSVLILMRKKLAAPVFLIELLALLITSTHNFVLSEVRISEIAGTGAMIFSVVIFVISILLWLYSRAQAKAGILT